ncbi:MAG: hypothetical protein U5R49_15540 [Deltaproteobacteria bacterium]|nr:hypothetical protein [Deltaproteobacteria bacterium]
MKQYFENMTPIGKALTEKEKEQQKENSTAISKVDQAVARGH